jgi:hypothetical protein
VLLSSPGRRADRPDRVELREATGLSMVSMTVLNALRGAERELSSAKIELWMSSLPDLARAMVRQAPAV